jgi:gliding motility-associated lipoprotein GldD
MLAALLLTGCGDDAVPKPKGWLRLDLPEQAHAPWQLEGAPFSAQVPVYATIAERNAEGAAHWYDMRFPGQRATVHLTYTPVQDDLPALIDKAHAFKLMHQSKAARIRTERALHPEQRVFGSLFDLEGDVASPFVFYITDSTSHFLYGALYFDARPNADSLAPVTERIRADMRHFAATLQWAPSAR